MHKQPHFREALFYELKFIFGLYSFALHLLKLVKDHAKVKQQPEAEILLFENYSFSSFILSLKLLRDTLRNVQQTNMPALMRLCDSLPWKWDRILKTVHVDTT